MFFSWNFLELREIKIYRMYTVSLNDRVTLGRCVVDYCGYMSLLRCVKRGIIWHMAFEDVSWCKCTAMNETTDVVARFFC